MMGSSKALSENQEAAKAVQQQLHNVCHDTRSLVNPKAQPCGALLTTVQQAKRCSSTERTNRLRYLGVQFNWMRLQTCGNNSTERQERSVSPEGYGCKCNGYWTTPPLPTASMCAAQCHWLRTRPHNNGADKCAKAGQSAERGNASHTGNHQGHTHWDHEIHARRPTNAIQKKCGVCQNILKGRRKSPPPTPWSCERHKGMQTGTWQVLDGSSRGLNTASMAADSTEAN